MLSKYLDKFCIAFLDDVLIYSNTLEEHVQHVRTILKTLLENGLYVSLEKCQFHVQKVSFLGYVITPEGISMEENRVTTITEWPAPKSITEVQTFLGFANFYRRFIQAYSCVVLPITSLLRKSAKFEWTAAAQAAFNKLKMSFTSAPILRHFDPELPISVYTDASGFATSAILCQPYKQRLHPVAFSSKKSNPAEGNYDIHDREMLAIVLAFQHWRHYLEGAKHTIQVYSDHKNLEVFMSTKVLNRRQARWAELLAGYDFVLVHTSGSKNPADGPSRRPDYANELELPIGTLLPPSSYPPQFAKLATISNSLIFTPEPKLHQRFIDALAQDPFAATQHNPSMPFRWKNGLLLHHTSIYVPEALRLEILRIHHDDRLAGHFGIARTLELLSRNYWFPSMLAYVKNYVETCDLCCRAKAPRHKRYGELTPLPVPSGPWKGITVDFITDLPPSNACDAILVFVDRFTKMAHLVPCNKTTDAPMFARFFLDYVVRLHGLPESIVSDRGSVFTSRFWTTLATLLGIKGRLSTAFHPQTDGQTE